MSQMVLPQASPQGPKADNSVKSANGGREKNGESPFDSVSRAEQQRIDGKQAERRDQARAEDAARNDKARQEKTSAERPEDREESTAANEARNSTDTTRGKDQPTKPSAKGSGTDQTGEGASPPVANQDILEEAVPLTFADLQALLMPAGGNNTPAAAGNVGGNAMGSGSMPGMQAFAGMMSGIPGLPGTRQGTTTGQASGAGAGPGLALTDALLSGVAADASRTQEPPSLQGAIRFQAATELASQQLANPNSAKLPAEAATLRGYTTSIDVPVNHAEWGDKLVGKLTWLTARNMSVAEIHLTPPDMGPMEVRVQVQQEQANITVHSANPAVRDQLELHSHRLRDMLSEQGLSLEQFDVSDSSQQQTGEDSAGEDQAGDGAALAEVGLDEQERQSDSLDLTWKGEVDIFA